MVLLLVLLWVALVAVREGYQAHRREQDRLSVLREGRALLEAICAREEALRANRLLQAGWSASLARVYDPVGTRRALAALPPVWRRGGR